MGSSMIFKISIPEALVNILYYYDIRKIQNLKFLVYVKMSFCFLVDLLIQVKLDTCLYRFSQLKRFIETFLYQIQHKQNNLD